MKIYILILLLFTLTSCETLNNKKHEIKEVNITSIVDMSNVSLLDNYTANNEPTITLEYENKEVDLNDKKKDIIQVFLQNHPQHLLIIQATSGKSKTYWERRTAPLIQMITDSGFSFIRKEYEPISSRKVLIWAVSPEETKEFRKALNFIIVDSKP